MAIAIAMPKTWRGQPQQYLARYTYLGNSTFNGVVTSGPLKGLEFLPNGTTRQFTFCDFNSALQRCGSRQDLPDLYVFTKLATPIQRKVG